jgi:hypothetical protein
MSDQAEQTAGTAMLEYLKSRVNRAQLAGMGAGLAAALLPKIAAAEDAE